RAAEDGSAAASDHRLDQQRVGAEGRGHLRGFENPEPAARARAHEHDASTAPQGGGHHLDADREPLALALHGTQHLAIFRVHQVDEIDGGQLVEAEAGVVDRLGGQRLPLRALGHGVQFYSCVRRINEPTGSDLVDAYLTHLAVERRLAANSIEGYARDLNQLTAFALSRSHDIRTLDRADLEAFVRAQMAEGRSPRSVARTVAGMRGFY